MRILVPLSAALLVVLALASGAQAKNFHPGDLRVCSAKRCVPITNQAALDALSDFYYSQAPLTGAVEPSVGAPFFQLRFTNGYVTGIVGTTRLDRFLSYGVNLGRFQRGKWYRVPAAGSRELRKLTVGLKPLRLTQAALAKSR
jgi:hypothetical protein